MPPPCAAAWPPCTRCAGRAPPCWWETGCSPAAFRSSLTWPGPTTAAPCPAWWRRICGSEISQSSDRFVLHTSIRRYLRRIAGKTAALFALAFHVGAVESSCEPSLVSGLRRLGYNLGMGFQIIDDVLDFEQSGAEIGKLTGGDLAAGIYTLPTILALKGDDGALARALARRPRSRRAIARTAALVAQRGGIAGARDLARRHTERSRRELCRLPDGERPPGAGHRHREAPPQDILTGNETP